MKDSDLEDFLASFEDGYPYYNQEGIEAPYHAQDLIGKSELSTEEERAIIRRLINKDD